jgi:GNAT superfamily N-acetyltransferase
VAAGLSAAGLGCWAPVPLMMLMGLVLGRSLGRTVGLGLYDGDKLVGGFRLKVSRRRNRLLLIGLYVEPAYRRCGGATLLLAAALEVAAGEVRDGGKVVAFTPTHPASRRLVEEFVAGGRMTVGSEEFLRARDALRAAVAEIVLRARDVRYGERVEGK